MYEVKGVTTKISATSRCAIKIKDNFYTIECSEERTIPNVDGVDLDAEYNALWDSVNTQTDNQMLEIYKSFKK